jgi:membrane protein implicated in regulation of membrane protease activity
MLDHLVTSANPLPAFIVGVIGTIAAAYYGAWWLAALLLVYSALVGLWLFRRARKVYREGQWQPS